MTSEKTTTTSVKSKEDILLQQLIERVVKAGTMAKLNSDTYINPKNMYTEAVVFFKTYIQIPLWVLVAVLLIILLRNLWGPGFARKYGIMSFYTILDMLSLISESAIIVIVTAVNKDYIIYEWCVLYIIMVEYLPYILLLSSQWLRVALAFQRFVFVYFPLSYKKYFKKALLVAVVIALLLVNASLCYLHYTYDVWIEKANAFDKQNKKLVEVCRVEQPTDLMSARSQKDKDMFYVFMYNRLVLSEIIPLVLMVVLSIALVIKIKQQSIFRRQFQTNVNAVGKDEDRILIIVTITTVISILNIIPLSVAFFLCVDFRECEPEETSFWDILNNVLKMLSSFLTFFLFACLSEKFRQLVLHICRRETHKNAVLANAT